MRYTIASLNIKNILRKAREAFRSGRHAEALENYEYFFDHALDDNRALNGIRLSYCLEEWSRLGKIYSKAWDRLESKKESTLVKLKKTNNPELFHDLIQICKYLEKENFPLELFISYHNEKNKITHDIIKFIWDSLVQKQLWEICAEYLNEPQCRSKYFLDKFDQSISLCKSDINLGGDDFERQIKDRYVKDISNILLILKHTKQHEIYSSVIKQVSSDLQSRGYHELVEEINKAVKQ